MDVIQIGREDIWFSASLYVYTSIWRKTMDTYEIGAKIDNLVWEIKTEIKDQIRNELTEELKMTLKAELTMVSIVRMLKRGKYTLEEIAEDTDYPLELVKKIKADFYL